MGLLAVISTDTGEQATLTGGGKVGDLIRSLDWSRSALGPIPSWPSELRANVQTILSSPVPMVVLWGPDAILIYNAGYASVCGPRHPEALGRRLLDVWPEAADFNRRVITASMRGEPLSFHAQELELWRSGAAERVWMDLEYTPIHDAAGNPAGMLAMVFDITARVLAERRLARSEALYRFLDTVSTTVSALHEADAVLTQTTRLVGEHLSLSNCAYADMDADQDGFSIRGDWHAPGSRSIVGHYRLVDFGRRAVEALTAGRPLVINDNRVELPAHEAATFQSIGIAATICMPLIKEGRLYALMAIHDRVPRRWSDYDLAVITEVTERSWAHIERTAAEANLRASEEQLRLAVDAAEVGLWDVDEVNGTLFWPARVKAMFGISPDVPVSMQDYYDGLHPDDFEGTAAAYAAAADPRRRAVYDVEYRTIGKEDGVQRWVAAKGRGVFEDDRCVRVIGTAIDITKRKCTEAALIELNATLERRVAEGIADRKLLADVVENTSSIILVADNEFRLLAVNRAGIEAFERIYGVRPKIGQSMLDALDHLPEHKAQVERAWRRALAGEAYSLTERFGDPSRERRCFEVNFSPFLDAAGNRIGAYQIVNDVTERVAEQARLAQAEEQLRQTQKVEALGQLTGGVAHDFNNLLTPIIGSLDLLSRRFEPDTRERKLIDGGLQSAERARVLVQRLLAFARRQPLLAAPIDVQTLLEGMADLIASTIGPKIAVELAIDPDLPPAVADYNQLEMAILNLSVNARDAMPGGGTLSITATTQTLGAGESEPAPGQYVAIGIRDTGIGMDEATLARAIEPFFSTKGIGKGTGLGLSMVHGLTRQLGGDMRIESSPGTGTKVELIVPVASDAAYLKPKPASPSPASSGSGLILLVDDEAPVRTSTAEMLRALGFDVIEACSGDQALAVVAERGDLAMVVTDQLMPGMGGTEIIDAVRRMRPELRCLIISGYAEVEKIARDLPRLSKPYRADELARAISAVLARPV